LTTTTIQNLLQALEDALKTENLLKVKVAPRNDILLTPQEVVPQVSIYMIEMEELMKNLLRRIRAFVERGEIITFSKLTRGLKRLERIRDFIVLLFLAHRKKISLWQREGSDEIYITLGEDALNGGFE